MQLMLQTMIGNKYEYRLVWQGDGKIAELCQFQYGACVQEWRGDIDYILDKLEGETGITVILPE